VSSGGRPTDAAFFTVSNDRHFIGAVTLLNSLRRVGHEEPFYLVDCGLTDRQRDILDGHATLISAPAHMFPTMLKPYGAVQVDPEVAVIMDADVIVVRPLTDLFGTKPVFFRNDTDRFFTEWLRLGYGRLYPAPYVNAGQMIVPRSSGFLPRYQSGVERLNEILGDRPPKNWGLANPFYFLDQEVLNALLCSVSPSLYTVSHEAAYYPFDEPVPNARFLHHILDKPWLTARRPNVYTEQMVELLDSGRVRLPAEEIPPQMRTGFRGDVARRRSAVQHTVHEHTRGRLGIRPRLAKLGGRR